MWSEIPIRLFLALLVPVAIVIPLRILAFPDTDPVTIVFLGPAFEESLKLACVVIVLTFAALALRGGRDPVLALRYWLFIAPWAVGGFFGLFEGLFAYPLQIGLLFTLREAAHATFVAVSLSAALEVWRRIEAPYFGIGYGFAAGLATHVGFNLIAWISMVDDATLLYLAAYLVLVLAFAIPALAWEVRQVPASAETRAFLPDRVRRVHP